MVKVRRGNAVLRIEPDDLDYYMGQGYSQIDDKGKIIKEAIPITKEELHKAYIENTDTIKVLKAKLKKLQAENEELKAAVKKSTRPRTTPKKK